MIKHIWTVLCRESKLDANTNNVSIIDSLENLQIGLNTEDPNYKSGVAIGAPMNFELVSLFFREKKGNQEEFEELVRVVDPKGAQLGEFTSKIVFQDEHDRVRNMVKFNSIAVTVSGIYVFQVFLRKKSSNNNGEPVATIPLNIELTVNGEKIENI